MATYRGVTIKQTWEFNDLGHENIASNKIINIFSDGGEDVYGPYGGGVTCGQGISIEDRGDSYDPKVTNHGTYYEIRNLTLTGTDYPTLSEYGNDAHTYIIPKGYYFGTNSNGYYYEGEYDDGSSFSSNEPSTIGINIGNYDGILFVSPSLSFSSMLSEINGIELYASDYDNDGEDDYWYSTGYSNMLFYAVTDIKFKEYYPSETNGNSSYYYEYISGSAAYVKGSATATSSTYTVKACSSYYQASNCDDYYTIEPSSVSLTSTPYLGKSVTISVTSPYGSRASTYGFPITYKYQYSTNSGSTWVDIASSTATSYSFTVPSNATTIMVRVIPSDSLGTGSAVASSNYTVQKASIIYAGKGGVTTITTVKACVGGGTYNYLNCNLQRRSYQNRLKRDFNTYLVVAVA